MWALVKSNKIEEIISSPKDMVIDDVRHPRALLPVTTSGTPLNSKYYIEKNEAFAIAGDKNSVVRTIGEKVADRKLDDEDAKDEDGKQLYEDDGITKIINYGLKTNAKRKATSDANGFCQGFNWLIQRKVTADTAIPSDVITYMAAIRTDHKAICDAIDGASDMNAFIALHTDTYKEVDGQQVVDVVARVNRWTDDKDVKQHRR